MNAVGLCKLFFVFVLSDLCNGQQTDKPDITTLYNGGSQICVAGGNTNGDGLVFMNNNLDNPYTEPEIVYKDASGSLIDKTGNCDFEQTGCIQYWTQSNKIGVVQSGSLPFEPITDERWNNLPVYRTNGVDTTDYKKIKKIPNGNFYYGISIRGTQDAQISLCEDSEVNKSQCYWIIIDGFVNYNYQLTAIRRCPDGLPEKWAMKQECKTLRHQNYAPNKLLSEEKWSHFILSRRNGNRIYLWSWDVHNGQEIILDYTDNQPFNIEYLHVRSYRSIADWKIHDYKYLAIYDQKPIIQLGPGLNFGLSTYVCVSMYISMCLNCRMTIELQKEDGSINIPANIERDPNKYFIEWQNVRLEGINSTSNYQLYYLFVKPSTKDGNTNGAWWAIDNFRKCSKNEIRVSKMEPSNKINCQSLKYTSWFFNPSKMSTYYDESPFCQNVQNIGSNCNISCESATGSKTCAGHKICQPINDNTIGACTCAPGYSWTSGCVNNCKYNYYGYNCDHKCGNCKNKVECTKATGYCVNGCESGYAEPFCSNPVYPRLQNAPTVVNISYTNIILQLTNTSTDGSGNATLFRIECKEIKQYYWQNCSEPVNFSPGNEVTVTGLKKETSYIFRAILYTDSGNSYRNDDVPTVNVSTTCKVEREIFVKPSSKEATINFIESLDNCELQDFKITILLNGKIEKSWTKAFPSIKVIDLKPYTTYEVKIAYQKSDYESSQFFATEQDAPGQIQNLQSIETTDTKIVLGWDKPKDENGVILKYTLSYELINRIECTGKGDISQNISIDVFPNDISRVEIKDLQPYSIYRIKIIAETIFPGTALETYFNTNYTDYVSDDELPDTINTSQIKAKEVTINWKGNCERRRGPLYYNIEIKCIEDSWCDLVENKTVLEKIYLSTKSRTINDLYPLTHYSVELRATRGSNYAISYLYRNTTFSTLGGIPPAVRNFKVYSKTDNSISVRWMEPYPPQGSIENYYLQYSYPGYIRTYITDWYIVKAMDCNLWTQNFKCATVNKLSLGYKYDISITAKNKESKYHGPQMRVSTYTGEGAPTVPLNLTRHWQNDELYLYWHHPDITNGPLKGFLITFRPNKTEITNLVQNKIYVYTHNIKYEKKNYTYLIKKSIRYSSSYVLTICGFTKHLGENATLLIDTPPATPELSGEVEIKKESATNTSVTIIIPGVKENTKSLISFMYVLVSKIKNSMSKREAIENEKSLKEEILQHSNSEDTWIAMEIEGLNEDSLEITLGNNETTNSEELNEEITNRQLEPSTSYEVNVVLMNKYRQQRSLMGYRLSDIRTTETIIPSESSYIIFTLLLLLLLPVTAFFLYRHVRNKNIKGRAMMMIPGLRVNRTANTQISEDQHDPDVIPLTESSNEPQSKPKKPTTAPKPTLSLKKSEEIATATDVNTTDTNFFHSRIVLLENLEEYLKTALKNGDLDEQHALFPRGQTKPWDYGMLKPNKFKNRYNNLIAYDKNRVKLDKINSDQYSDYINASYIHGYRQDKAYIATQGPKLATVNDFWRMIWQEKVQYIVMLANVVEAGKKKCEKYWPDIDSSRIYGNIEVYFERSEVYADFEYRTFDLTCKGEKRKLTQLHFTSWPDHGVPLYPQSLVPFLKKMLTIPQSTAPVVVHCSAGVGRTGTIILCDICLRMAAREKAIDVLRYLHEIREQRANMVDNIDQYKLVHMVLLECLLAPDTNIPCNGDLSNTVQKMIEEGSLQIQLNYLQQTEWQNKALNFNTPKKPNPLNDSKNRCKDILPLANQIYISRFPVEDENSDYINAVPVDGFRFKEQFIVTQIPLPNTVKDFWRMVFEKSVKVIVSLNDIPENDETCCTFWPPESEESKPIPSISLKHHKTQTHEYYTIHSIILSNKASQESSLIQIIQFKNWNHVNKLPDNEENLVMLWEEAENLSRGNYPMIVTCYDGATASGLFVAMSFVIEKIKLEQQCDVCLAVRVVRRNRTEFVANKAQFEFLYRAAVIYLSMFETYSNFQPVVNKQSQNEN